MAVGTELLLGQIPNTNAQWISQELAKAGVDVMFHTVVGDNEQRIAESINRALSQSDVLIITGGLGPTHDDLTREAMALATGRKLERIPELEDELRARFAAFGRRMASINLRQADRPEGAETIPNPRGTAPGVYLEFEGKQIFAVPGVPSEMEAMVNDHVIPRLQSASGNVVLSRIVKVVGLTESEIGEMLSPLITELDSTGGVTVALLAGAGEIRVRLTAKAPSSEEASALIDPVEQRVREILGSPVYGVDQSSLEATVSELMLKRGLTLAVAESITGGLVSSRLVGVPGTSEFLAAGYVTYSIGSKIEDLGVSKETIEAHGAVSEETVREMAQGVRTRAGADLGLATSGEAGPEPQEAPVGTICVGLAWDGGETSRKFRLPSGDRELIRMRAASGALNLLRLWLIGEAE